MWEAVADPVLDGRCAIGLMGSLPPAPPQFSRERLLTVRAIKVVSPRHPLAAHRALIPMNVLCEHIQLVHADHANVWRAGRSGLLSPRIWRLCDPSRRSTIFCAPVSGLASCRCTWWRQIWQAASSLRSRLRTIRLEGHGVDMSAVYLTDSPLGPAGRWFIGSPQRGSGLPEQCQRCHFLRPQTVYSRSR